MLTVEVAIATTSSRVHTLKSANLPMGKGWCYRVYCQGDALNLEGLDLSVRDDVSFVASPGTGAARNRNLAIETSTADIILFCDDDVVVLEEGLSRLSDIFEADPNLSLLAGRALNEFGENRKRYSAPGAALTLFNAAKVGTIELAVRTKDIKNASVRFDTNYGAGARWPIGDEYIFLADAVKRGLQGRHEDVHFTVHSSYSSGENWSAESGLHRGKALDRVFGVWSDLPKLFFLIKNIGKVNSGSRVRFAHEFLCSRVRR